jgi:hypothetical protein
MPTVWPCCPECGADRVYFSPIPEVAYCFACGQEFPQGHWVIILIKDWYEENPDSLDREGTLHQRSAAV